MILKMRKKMTKDGKISIQIGRGLMFRRQKRVLSQAAVN